MRALVVLVALCTIAHAQPGSGSGSGSGKPRIIQLPNDIHAPQVSAAANPTVVRLGAKFTVFITATYAEGVYTNIAEPIELGSAFEVRRKVSEDRTAPDGRHVREWQLEVIPWELGDLSMAPIVVTYTAFGKVGQVPSNELRLRVVGVLGDAVDDPKLMREQHGPASLWARDWFWVWAAIVGGGVAIAVLLVLLLLRRKTKKTVRLVAGAVAAPRRIDMTSERALERLMAIERSGVLDRDDDRKGGYDQMVDVIREYLGARYRVATLDLTPHELLVQLEKVAPADEHDLVEAWLGACELVKYGGLRATQDEARRVLDDARALIVTTTRPAGMSSTLRRAAA
jgi:hypothetical protein